MLRMEMMRKCTYYKAGRGCEIVFQLETHWDSVKHTLASREFFQGHGFVGERFLTSEGIEVVFL